MNELDVKINKYFPGLVVRKDLVKTVKGNAIVPTYVLEYLLGQYCATSDEASIQSGIETVKEILRKHYVHRNESGLIRSIIKEKGRHKVIDKIGVALNDKADVYEATFANLGIKNVMIDSDTVKKHPKLLVSGIWCIADLEYDFSEEKGVVPWILDSIKPIQLSNFDFDSYIEGRKQFTTDEWIDLLVQSIGFNPEMFNKRSKLLQLVRLIPYCERNFNLIELGPKGTGKSHIYSEFSPHGILISGGEVTVPKLFVNNSTGKIGLVGYWDTVAFDEFAGRNKRTDNALVDIMKNYLANKSFSRGIETLGAEASMVFIGNTKHPLLHMLRHADLFMELPERYYDSAFLDRLHFYIPGWEVEIIRGEMFSAGYGFVVDFLAEILRAFRNYDFSDRYSEYFELRRDISTRDRDGINKTFSGLMKILFPHNEATQEEIEEMLCFAIEGRKRVKDQLMRIDSTYAEVRFGYTCINEGKEVFVSTLEEQEYPEYFKSSCADDTQDAASQDLPETPDKESEKAPPGSEIQETISVEDLISHGESSTMEFKSTLRWNIKAKRDDKEMGLIVMKTVCALLNTEGGTVLVGVQDDGTIIGIDLDHFPNDDKYLLHFGQLLNNHIGPEFTAYIHYYVIASGDHIILRVDCEKSNTSVYLRDGDSEDMYIRNGPANVKLSARQSVDYEKKHFK